MDIPDLHPPSSRRRGIMLCQPYDTRRLAKWEPPYIVQPKLDGERCRAIITPTGVAVLLSSEEHIITSVPHINRALEQSGLRDIELDCELYTHGMYFEEVHSRVGRTVNQHDDSERIELHVFDIVEGGTQAQRLLHLYRLPLRPPLYIVPYSIAADEESIYQHLLRYQEMKYEGIIVRHTDALYQRKRSLWVMKWKPRRDDYYNVVGWVEEVSLDGTPKERLGALVCAGDDGTQFNVGTGFTATQREELWARRDQLAGQLIHIKYQHLTPGKQVPRNPVYFGIVDPLEIGG